MVGYGSVRCGMARSGKAWRGGDRFLSTKVKAGRGEARLVVARQGRE